MKVFIETLGCPKNFNDSEFARGILEEAGHLVIENIEEADAIMVNTCGFINDAKVESIDKIFEMADFCGDDKLLIVSGCLSERYKDDLAGEIPEADIFVGVNDYDKLPALLDNAVKGKQSMAYADCDCGFYKPEKRIIADGSVTATVKIAEGCNNICTYCAIPYIRGKYRSKKMEDIITEAEMLAASGTKELIVIAQDTTYYGMDLYGELKLAELLSKLCKVEGLKWIRLMYCYEEWITDELIETIAREDKICKYLDIPIQHSHDKILKMMNRRSTKASIMSTIERLKKAIPDICIRTTLITGFPGERAAEYEDLYDFVEATRFDRLGVFAYSREEGTPADRIKGHVRQDVKEKRRDNIMRLQSQISLEKNQEKIGTIQEVFVEGQDEDGSYYGRSKFDAPEIDNAVLFTSDRDLKYGDFVNVKIIDAFDYDLVGVEEQ